MSLSLNHLLHVPCITKNLIRASKFARDNGVYFEFHSNYCAVKSQVTNEVLLQGSVGPDGLYSFSNIQFQNSSSCSASCCLFLECGFGPNSTHILRWYQNLF